ncbi:hypothetical protein [Mycobacterium paragordonae]|uniref:Uncharacterized protein n=1 Tax=Mycobacterium paragordonae TaxID=1389713 RepID=A0AAJ1S458_9MYCO|nr:hypothetical protein [Mycobacterium paragordonae]MDP7736487.1 hypothetical protein [Mycobacterium paragordonae]
MERVALAAATIPASTMPRPEGPVGSVFRAGPALTVVLAASNRALLGGSGGAGGLGGNGGTAAAAEAADRLPEPGDG